MILRCAEGHTMTWTGNEVRSSNCPTCRGAWVEAPQRSTDPSDDPRIWRQVGWLCRWEGNGRPCLCIEPCRADGVAQSREPVFVRESNNDSLTRIV